MEMPKKWLLARARSGLGLGVSIARLRGRSPTGVMDMQWTANETSLIKQLAPSTEYKLIAAQLGRPIGAVCAKIARLKEAGELPKTAKKPPRITRIMDDRAPRRDDPIFDAINTLNALEAITYGGKLVTLEERAEDGCSYICGDPATQAACYCPQVAVPGQSWCAQHHARVFKTVRARGSVRVYQPKREEALVGA